MSAIPNINEAIAAAVANASSESTGASTDTGGCSDCQMCKKSPGLVILPVRYAAIAESHAHAINGLTPIVSGGSFGDGVLDKPMQRATYILRCMRPGYFYLHFPSGDAEGAKWRKYRVTTDSNFIPLPIDGRTAPGMEKSEACRRSSDWQMARCVTISRPEQVTEAWLAFSDTDWNDSIRAEVERDPSARMQFLNPSLCISPAASQPHTAPLSAVTEWVSEYRPNTTQSFRSTVADQDDSQNTATFESVYPFQWRAFEADDLIETAERTSQGRSILFATHDPRGITVELNAEQIQAVSASLQRHSWVIASVHGIRSIRAAVESEAESQYRDSVLGPLQNSLEHTESQLEEVNRQIDNGDRRDELLAYRVRLEENRRLAEERIERLEEERLDEERLADIRQQAWQDTRDGDTYLNKSDEAIDRDYQQALDAINEKKQACSDPLSEDHATWLQSASLARVFQTDYLTSRLDSGIEYVDHFIECIEEAADRAECAAVLQQWACAGDVTDPTNMLLRSLGHNQESHLAAIQDTPSLITLQNAASVLDGYRRAWEASREAVLQSHQAESAARNAFSRLMHQSSAPVARLLSKGLDQAVMHVYMAAAMFSTDRILIQRGVRGTPAQHIAMMAKQSRELIPANKRPSQRQMEKVIRQWLKKDGAALDIKVPHFFYLDREMLAAVANGHGGGGATTTRLLRTDGDILLTARNMRESVLPNFRRVIDSDVRMSSVGLFFTAISTYYAQNALEHARPFKSTEMRWRYYSCISSLVGGISELASKAFKGLERVGYLRPRPLVVIGLDVAGRLFGAAGAWIMAGLDGINASKEYKKGNWGLSFLYGLSSFFGILLGIALIMLSLSWVAILFVISLILSVLLSWFAAEYTQEWLSHSFYGTADRFESVKASKKELANVLG